MDAVLGSAGHGLGVVPEAVALDVKVVQAPGQDLGAAVLGIGPDGARDDQLGGVSCSMRA
jgi:hypothetical protein